MSKLIEIMDFVWGLPLTIIIVAAGLYFCYCTKLIQFFGVKKVYRNTVKKLKNSKNNSYKTITSVLGGTIGTGNVAGVATAIAVGGPGAILWMWIIAFISMATKMVEVTLAVNYHKKDKDGNYVGGPMYYLKAIKGKLGIVLAAIYTGFLFVYVLCDSGFVQMNTAATSILDTFNVSKVLIAGILIFIATFIVAGGLKRVSKVLSKSVPIMFIFYFIAALIVIITNYHNIPVAFANIFKYAFKPAPVIGGFAGATVLSAISKGAARGIFANEAGIGTSTMVHATSDNEPVVQGMWGIFEVFIVSFVVCTLTALLIMSTGVWTNGSTGAPLVLSAFSTLYGSIGKYVLCFVIVTFALSSYIGFTFEFTSCIRYFFGEKLIKYLKWLYIVPIIFAVFLPIEYIWSFADMSIGFIIIPNLIGLVLLSKKFKELFKKSKALK